MMNLSQQAPDSETESLIVHSNGDANMEDLLSETEFETDVEIENSDGVKLEYRNLKSSSLSDEPTRTKTRLLSRSHSADDLTVQVDEISSEPPRRNSSGEYPTQIHETPTTKPPVFLHDIEMPKYKYISRNLSPASSLHPSPVQYPLQTNWKSVQNVQDKDDEFTILLQTTAERVLNKLKSRQQDLGSSLSIGQRRRPSHPLQPHAPRKLQPITRGDGKNTPRSECGLKSSCSDSDLGPLSAA
ncbi:uncharacterized protein [Parasteatoda tepidariorum]|uniref:uncharacterized protein n=1 Tax=Parasteatoda tepidariorum TaxID=114398 RepID=UPI0039BCD735